MPLGCQSGVGSLGFGVWHEVAANTMATELGNLGGLGSFPAMYHWRVMDRPVFDGGLFDAADLAPAAIGGVVDA